MLAIFQDRNNIKTREDSPSSAPPSFSVVDGEFFADWPNWKTPQDCPNDGTVVPAKQIDVEANNIS